MHARSTEYKTLSNFGSRFQRSKRLTIQRAISEDRGADYRGPPDFTKGKSSTGLTKLIETLKVW